MPHCTVPHEMSGVPGPPIEDSEVVLERLPLPRVTALLVLTDIISALRMLARIAELPGIFSSNENTSGIL